MAGVITTTSQLNDSVKALYDSEFQMAATGEEVHDGLCFVKKVTNGERGSTVEFTTFEQTDVATSTLSETSDIAPVALTDSPVVITLAEYGNALVSTKFLKATAFNDVEKAATANMAVNRARSLDIVTRGVIVGGTDVFRPNGRVTRATLATSSDTISWAFLNYGTSRARTRNMPPTSNGDLVAPVNPILLADLVQISLWQNVSAYQGEGMDIYEGEVGKLAGVRFVQTYTGKVYLSGGTVAQAATTSTAAVAAGDTSIVVTSATGLAAGHYITVGTLESSLAEQVLITAVSSTTLTIQGVGNTQSNFGFRYAHASGVAVTEADQVAAIPLMGAQSVAKAYSSLTGPRGQVVLAGPFDHLGRFRSIGWYFIGGWSVASQKWIERLEVAATLKFQGAEQY